jgi:hypothetical protein
MDSGVVDSGTPADAMADTRDSSTIPDSSMPDTAVMDTGTPPPPPSPIVQVAAGTRHTCALRDDGRVVCWGSPGAALGYGETANTSYPVFAIGITDAVHVGAGGEHTCAVRSSGQVSCWGRNGYGEAGAAFSTWRLTPNPVADVTEGVMVAVGADHSCVLNDGLTVDMAQCWGRNNVHQIVIRCVLGRWSQRWWGDRFQRESNMHQASGSDDLVLGWNHQRDLRHGAGYWRSARGRPRSYVHSEDRSSKRSAGLLGQQHLRTDLDVRIGLGHH